MMDDIGKNKFVLFCLTIFPREIQDPKKQGVIFAVSTKLIDVFRVKIL
jgi:hypothetical protein